MNMGDGSLGNKSVSKRDRAGSSRLNPEDGKTNVQSSPVF